jgi:UDPglucose 6-dehydrogenase
MKCGIIGYGHVGTAMHNRFQDAIIYDELKNIGTKEEINKCDIVFVCVPTPEAKDGSCETAIVESVILWIESEVIVIRSTVPVGFTAKMVEKYEKKIVFQPEYYGETVAHPFADLKNQHWISLGGTREAVSQVMLFYQEHITSEIHFYMADSNTVEFAKYMENTFLATKVTFCNEMYDLATKLGIEYNMAREIWLVDPRIGRSHTFVYPANRGYGGNCLPKDTKALVSIGEAVDSDMTLLKSVIAKNALLRKDCK